MNALNEDLAAQAADYVAVRQITETLGKLHEESERLYAEYETLIYSFCVIAGRLQTAG